MTVKKKPISNIGSYELPCGEKIIFNGENFELENSGDSVPFSEMQKIAKWALSKKKEK